MIIATVLKGLFSHIFEMALFVAFALFFKASIIGLAVYPLILLFFCIFIAGASFILSALVVYVIDLDNVWTFVARLIWLGTPIFYAIAGQTRLFYVNLFNPMYYFITIARDVLIYAKMPQAWMAAGAATYSLLFLGIGLLVFNRLKIKFAEMM